jgi:hypothetical protein
MRADAMEQFVLALCFRHAFQIPDCAARNFIHRHDTGRIHSVDEDATTLGRGDPPRGNRLVPGGQRMAAVRQFIKQADRLAGVLDKLAAWLTVLADDAEAKALLACLPRPEQVRANLGLLISTRLECALC